MAIKPRAGFKNSALCDGQSPAPPGGGAEGHTRDIPRGRSSVFRSRAIRDAGISVPQKKKGPMCKGLLRMLDLAFCSKEVVG
jgi:hypothetical protein